MAAGGASGRGARAEGQEHAAEQRVRAEKRPRLRSTNGVQTLQGRAENQAGLEGKESGIS